MIDSFFLIIHFPEFNFNPMSTINCVKSKQGIGVSQSSPIVCRLINSQCSFPML